jgi:hypothetical protein
MSPTQFDQWRSIMKSVWAVWHVYEDKSGNDETKFVGVFSSEERAKAAVIPLRDKPGFRDHPAECFEIHEQTIDLVGWSEGFSQVDDEED